MTQPSFAHRSLEDELADPAKGIMRTFGAGFEIKPEVWLSQHGLVWEMGQPWLPTTEPEFAGGQVFLGRSHEELLIMADLSDAHVMKDVFPLNYPAFSECDAFEIFLGIEECDSYYELHVTPSNSIFQLYFKGGNSRESSTRNFVSAPLFSSQSWNNQGGWGAFCRIPIRSLFPKSHARLQLSFGRYDYPPNRNGALISTTSTHSVCDFHRKTEWKSILFEEIPLLPSSIL